MKLIRELKLVLAGGALLLVSGLAPAPMPGAAQDADAQRAYVRRRPAARVAVRGTARRTARRVTRRHMYALPRGYTTTVVSGSTIYVVEGVQYKKVIIDGRVAYVVY